MAKAAAGHAAGAALKPRKSGACTSAANEGNDTMIECKAAIKVAGWNRPQQLYDSAG